MRGDDVVVVSGALAFALVAGPGAVLLAVAAALALVRRSLRRQAAAERASLEANPLLLRPGRVALAGTVETFDGEVDQVPVKAQGAARPFLLRLASGVRVRVEPGARPVLRDEERELTAGERVFVRGVLQGPVSEAPHVDRAVLRAPRWGRVLLSTEAFSGALDRRADDAGLAVGLNILGAVLSQLFYGGFYLEALLHLLGREEPPTIVLAFYFWVALISGSVILGSVLSLARASPESAPPRAARPP